MDWLSPTGHNDPGNNWNDEAKAYDELTGTNAYTDPLGYYSWSGGLELTVPAISCSKVRFNARYADPGITSINLDVYYEGAWHDVYDGAFAHHVWVEKSIPEGTKVVTKARVNFWCNVASYQASLYEFDFWGVLIVVPTVTTQDASFELTSAILNGNITDIGNENCDYRGFVWDTSSHGDPGNTVPSASAYANYWTEAGSFGTGAFSHGINGLSEGQTYYCRACAHNSAGWSYGGEVSFTTKGAEKCPVGSETSWAWGVPTSGGPDKTPQGSPTSFLWGSE